MKLTVFLISMLWSLQVYTLDLTSRYFQSFFMNRPGPGRISTVIYGNDTVGYFKTANFSVGRKIKFRNFLPPTYREEIKFFAVMSNTNQQVYLGAKKFINPTPKAIQSIKPYYKSGKLTQNYIVVSASIPKAYLQNIESPTVEPDLEKKNKNRFVFLMALNKNLEIIWVYLPMRGANTFNSYIAYREIEKNKFGFVLGKKDGYYASINSEGDILDLVDGSQGKHTFPMHHDFTFIDDDKLLTFSNRYAKLKNLEDEKKLFLSNTIITVDLKKNKVHKTFDFLKFYRPTNVGHWQENLIKQRWVVWDGRTADHDFVHANSIEYYKNKGVLVSLKHLDKLVMIDEDFGKILWTIGPTKKDTFQATGLSRFSHQHDAKYIDDNNIVIFDNGYFGRKSRAVSYRLNRNIKRVEMNWQFSPKPKLYSPNRSGISPLPDGLYMAHFVSPNGRKLQDDLTMDHDIIFIFNPISKKIKCELYIPFRTRSAGYRSFLFDSLGAEEFLGSSLSSL